MNPTINTILKRRSVRAYTAEQLSDDLLARSPEQMDGCAQLLDHPQQMIYHGRPLFRGYLDAGTRLGSVHAQQKTPKPTSE